MLGAARPAVLKSNRERGLSARVPRPPRRSREAVTPSAWLDLSELSCGDGGDVHVTHRVSDLQQFPLQQFRCSPGRLLDLSQPGVLVLYTSQVGIVSAFLRAGAPWVLSFDSQKGADQDLACSALQLRLEGLISAGAFRIVGGFGLRCAPALAPKGSVIFLRTTVQRLKQIMPLLLGFGTSVSFVLSVACSTGSHNPTPRSFGFCQVGKMRHGRVVDRPNRPSELTCASLVASGESALVLL